MRIFTFYLPSNNPDNLDDKYEIELDDNKCIALEEYIRLIRNNIKYTIENMKDFKDDIYL